MKYVEITSELFYSIKNSSIPAYSVESTETYTDITYIIKGVKFLVRLQNGYFNYYIYDINS